MLNLRRKRVFEFLKICTRTQQKLNFTFRVKTNFAPTSITPIFWSVHPIIPMNNIQKKIRFTFALYLSYLIKRAFYPKILALVRLKSTFNQITQE